MVLDIKNDAGFENSSGLGLSVLTDCQKLVACKVASDEEKSYDAYYPVEKNHMMIRATSQSYSARVNLLYRSNACLKTWGPNLTVLRFPCDNVKVDSLIIRFTKRHVLMIYVHLIFYDLNCLPRLPS